jgi:hypothetical protein
MDANTPLWKAHDISQQLQDKIELLPNVERAFVHVDHESTHVPVRYLLLAPEILSDLIVRSIEKICMCNDIMDRPSTHYFYRFYHREFMKCIGKELYDKTTCKSRSILSIVISSRMRNLEYLSLIDFSCKRQK